MRNITILKKAKKKKKLLTSLTNITVSIKMVEISSFIDFT